MPRDEVAAGRVRPGRTHLQEARRPVRAEYWFVSAGSLRAHRILGHPRRARNGWETLGMMVERHRSRSLSQLTRRHRARPGSSAPSAIPTAGRGRPAPTLRGASRPIRPWRPFVELAPPWPRHRGRHRDGAELPMPDHAGPELPPPTRPPDRITEDLDTTLFVEAGAGSGKTSALVNRVLALVTSGRAELRRIAAITFTEKAGAELRDRIRRELEKRGRGRSRRRGRRALPETPSSSSTGPPSAPCTPSPSACCPNTRSRPASRRASRSSTRSAPRSPSSGAGRCSAISSWPTRPRAHHPASARLRRRQEALRSLAEAFDDNWDLVEERVPEATGTTRRSTTSSVGPAGRRRRLRRALPIRRQTPDPARRDRGPDGRAGGHSPTSSTSSRPSDPRPSRSCPASGGGQHRKAGVVRLRHLAELKARVARGRRAVGRPSVTRWPTPAPGASAAPSASSPWTPPGAPARRPVGVPRSPRPGPGPAAPSRPRAGRASHPPPALPAPASRRVPGHRPHPDRAGRPHRRRRPPQRCGRDAPVGRRGRDPGHLFVVGDPKQSIYRFRRADISTFLKGGRTLRCRGRWGGRAHGQLPDRPTDHRLGQPHLRRPHERTRRRRPAGGRPSRGTWPWPIRPAPGTGPAVAVLGTDEHPKEWRADDLRAAEADEVAATVTRDDEGWDVERRPPAAGARPDWATSPCSCPARTSLPFPGGRLRPAPASPSGPSRARSSTPAGPCGTCSWCSGPSTTPPTTSTSCPRCARRCWPAATTISSASRRSGAALELSGRPARHRPRRRSRPARPHLPAFALRPEHLAGPSELLGRIARDRRAMELGFAEGRPRDVWRRLRFVIDQARAWSEATGGNLRQYLRWVTAQTAEGAGWPSRSCPRATTTPSAS
jgi:ATP-dependent helicase/nuclease subunit A